MAGNFTYSDVGCNTAKKRYSFVLHRFYNYKLTLEYQC